MTRYVADLRHAARQLLQRPAATAISTLILACGIAAAVIVFSLLDTLVLRPLPLRAPDRLVAIGTQPPPDAAWTKEPVPLPILKEWQESAGSFEEIAGFADRQFTWQGPQGPERVVGAAAYGDLFSLLGVPMTVGRAFAGTETAAVVLSHGFWRQRFGARPDIVGTSILLDGIDYTVAGVLPPEPDVPLLGGDRVVWIALPPAGAGARNPVMLHVVGRLRSGVSAAAAEPELETIQHSVAQELGENPLPPGVVLQSVHEQRAEIVGPTLTALFGGACVLLLVACANVGLLTLAQLLGRRQELAVRASLGATRGRLLRLILTERLLLWSVGGALGVALGVVGLRAVLHVNPFPAEIPAPDAIAVNGRAVLFAVGVTLATAALFGVPPALRASSDDPVTTLREGGTGGSPSRASRLSRSLLVAGQVALSTVLATGACLLALSLYKLTTQPLGFDAEGLSTFQVQLSARDYPEQGRRSQFQHALLEHIRALPGVSGIVGVVGDVKHAGLDWDYLPEIFVPYDQLVGAGADALGLNLFVVLRTPPALVPSDGVLRKAVAALDPNVPVMDMLTGDQIVAASTERARFQTWVLGAVALLAVALSGIGLYGVLGQSIGQRRRELGIRMALGATPRRLGWLVCRHGVGLAVVGTACGIATALALARGVQSLLYDVSATDPTVLGAVAAFMALVALVAAVVPSVRAARRNPALAVRGE
jgi:ABC-type antimicrobial peptide transport system permease subunit